MIEVGDAVLRVFDRKEGYVATEMGGVVIEDDYGAMPTSAPAMVWVRWDDISEFPEHISRERLVKIAGFGIRSIADGPSEVAPSKIFASRKDAAVYQTAILSDSDGTHYSIVPVNEQGVAL
jgi:hypothetical protein